MLTRLLLDSLLTFDLSTVTKSFGAIFLLRAMHPTRKICSKSMASNKNLDWAMVAKTAHITLFFAVSLCLSATSAFSPTLSPIGSKLDIGGLHFIRNKIAFPRAARNIVSCSASAFVSVCVCCVSCSLCAFAIHRFTAAPRCRWR